MREIGDCGGTSGKLVSLIILIARLLTEKNTMGKFGDWELANCLQNLVKRENCGDGRDLMKVCCY